MKMKRDGEKKMGRDGDRKIKRGLIRERLR